MHVYATTCDYNTNQQYTSGWQKQNEQMRWIFDAFLIAGALFMKLTIRVIIEVNEYGH